MKTVGVDLASQPRNTALCVVDWSSRASISSLEVGCDNDAILVRSAHERAGGHRRAVRLAAAVRRGGRGVGRHRALERAVGPGHAAASAVARDRPLDRGAPAQVAAVGVLGQHRRRARCAQPRCWTRSGPSTEWTGPASRSTRVQRCSPGLCRPRATSAIRRCAPRSSMRSPLDLADERLVASDHAFDALLCALVARAAALGLTHRPPATLDPAVVAREGSIHVPVEGSLARLSSSTT